jgi:hypothetical protein
MWHTFLPMPTPEQEAKEVAKALTDALLRASSLSGLFANDFCKARLQHAPVAQIYYWNLKYESPSKK